MKKPRLDALLVERGLFPTRAKAQAAVMAGQVLVDGRAVAKAGQPTDPEAELELVAPCPFVSRGGLKLDPALSRFRVDVAGRVCLDLGASTGGFTDCLLQRGAAKVYAVDVGRGQLDAKLRGDPRVASFEETHARDLGRLPLDPPPDLAVVDVSFISATAVLGPAVSVLRRPFELLVLVKPQFEVGPKLAPKGVVRDPAARAAALEKVSAAAAAAGLDVHGSFESPVHGPKGNVESFLYIKSAIV